MYSVSWRPQRYQQYQRTGAARLQTWGNPPELGKTNYDCMDQLTALIQSFSAVAPTCATQHDILHSADSTGTSALPPSHSFSRAPTLTPPRLPRVLHLCMPERIPPLGPVLVQPPQRDLALQVTPHAPVLTCLHLCASTPVACATRISSRAIQILCISFVKGHRFYSRWFIVRPQRRMDLPPAWRGTFSDDRNNPVVFPPVFFKLYIVFMSKVVWLLRCMNVGGPRPRATRFRLSSLITGTLRPHFPPIQF